MRHDWQNHHLFPRRLTRGEAYPDLQQLLTAAGRRDPGLVARTVALPATHALAARTGLPLHRGPHPAYDAWVAERLSRLLPVARALGEPPLALLEGLQSGLQALLLGGGWAGSVAQRRAPFAERPGFDGIDARVEQLGARLFGG